jgi:hypothetical protein|tara:strand:+ start:180 stop:326 length:147 start_codon:yes stop_codon:yes gene_type:complete
MLAETACCSFGGGTGCEGELKLEEVTETVDSQEVIINYLCKKKNIHLF